MKTRLDRAEALARERDRLEDALHDARAEIATLRARVAKLERERNEARSEWREACDAASDNARWLREMTEDRDARLEIIKKKQAELSAALARLAKVEPVVEAAKVRALRHSNNKKRLFYAEPESGSDGVCRCSACEVLRAAEEVK